MKKLHIVTLMTLAVGSCHLYGAQEHIIDVQENQTMHTMELQAAKEEVIQDLAEQNPDMINQIIDDEDDLGENFAKIRNFVTQKNKEIEKLSTRQDIQEAEIARLAIELADAQATLERTIQKQRTKHRKQHKLEQKIKDSLMKAEQSLKNIQKKITPFLQSGVEYIQQATSKKIE